MFLGVSCKLPDSQLKDSWVPGHPRCPATPEADTALTRGWSGQDPSLELQAASLSGPAGASCCAPTSEAQLLGQETGTAVWVGSLVHGYFKCSFGKAPILGSQRQKQKLDAPRSRVSVRFFEQRTRLGFKLGLTAWPVQLVGWTIVPGTEGPWV